MKYKMIIVCILLFAMITFADSNSTFYYYQQLNCVGNCSLTNIINVTDTTQIVRQDVYEGGLTEWDFAFLINQAMDNLDGKGRNTPESRLIANALASHFVMQNQFNYTMNDVYSQLTTIEIRQMILEKAVNMTNPTAFCNAKKDVLTELGLIYIKCDDAVYWYNGIQINMSPEFPISVKIVTPDNTANVVLNGMQEIDITDSMMKSLTVEIGNRGEVTETAVISIELPENKYIYPQNFTITLAPHQLVAVAFLIKRDVGETCVSDQDCRIGFCMPAAASDLSQKICRPRVYFKAPSTAYDGDSITVQLLSEEDKPIANALIEIQSSNGGWSMGTHTDANGTAIFPVTGPDVFTYVTDDYRMREFSPSTNVYAKPTYKYTVQAVDNAGNIVETAPAQPKQATLPPAASVSIIPPIFLVAGFLLFKKNKDKKKKGK